MDIVGSIWEDETRSDGRGRFILIISAEEKQNYFSLIKVKIIEIDNNSFHVEQLDFDYTINNFPHLDLKRIC
jgi:hypothetical protein